MARRKEPVDALEEIEGSEQSRRDFITRLVATAGAVAAAGLVAGAQGADAETQKLETGKIQEYKDWVQLKYGKIRSGFRLSLTGRQLGVALQGAGLLSENVNLDNATLTIEFTA